MDTSPPYPSPLCPSFQLNVADPIAVAVDAAGPDLFWLRPVVKVGAILGLTSVIMVLLMGQARIFYAMAEVRPEFYDMGLLCAPIKKHDCRFDGVAF